jgi:chaperone modulatory protein CbpM
MIKGRRLFSIIEATEATGLDGQTIVTFIEKEWISPPESKNLDEEDIARIGLIQELRSKFGVNDEAVPLILHLVDQLFCLKNKLSKLKGDENE